MTWLHALALLPIVAGAILIALMMTAEEGWQDKRGYHRGRHPDDVEP